MQTHRRTARPGSADADRAAAHRMFAEVEATVLELRAPEIAELQHKQDHVLSVLSRAVQMLAIHTEGQIVSRVLKDAPAPQSALIALASACGTGLADWAILTAERCQSRDELQDALLAAGSAFMSALLEAVAAEANQPET